ncbi:MAG: NAD(P)-dependent oxidoreductase [Anaerolineae bacterium]|nr:NAD(P)-dependent oxidoreductase [Anaerolineae bacterium]
MKILVTGSRGYCGVAMVPTLLARGHQIVGLDVSPLPADYREEKNHREMVGSMTDVAVLAASLDGCAAVIHMALAWKRGDEVKSVPLNGKAFRDDITFAHEANVGSTVLLLEAMRQHNIRQMVFISTVAVVMDNITLGPHRPIKEIRLDAHVPPGFHDHYGLVKYLQEQVGEFYARNYSMSVIVLRPCWVVDGYSNRTKFGKPLSDPGDRFYFAPAGFVDRYDLGEACHLALQRPDIVFDIFYPAAGPQPERFFDVEHIRRELGWYPRYTFEDVVQI